MRLCCAAFNDGVPEAVGQLPYYHHHQHQQQQQQQRDPHLGPSFQPLYTPYGVISPNMNPWVLSPSPPYPMLMHQPAYYMQPGAGHVAAVPPVYHQIDAIRYAVADLVPLHEITE